jgi:hypothetical protein
VKPKLTTPPPLRPLTPLAFGKLPSAARKRVSKKQLSYIDEFRFYREQESGHIEAWYAGLHLATWNGKEWVAEQFKYDEKG